MSVKRLTEAPLKPVKAGEDVTFQVLISPDEGPSFAMRRFIMEPDGGIPKHTNAVEHEQFVLRGQARIGIGNEVFEVKVNDVIFIPHRCASLVSEYW
jgi:quercetin dioxygenase-like cupin family protein